MGICGKNQNRQLPTILIIAEKLTVSVSFSAIFHNFFIATTGCRIDIGGVVEGRVKIFSHFSLQALA